MERSDASARLCYSIATVRFGRRSTRRRCASAMVIALLTVTTALLVPHRGTSTHAPRQQLGRRECLGLGLGLGLGGLAGPLQAVAEEEEIEVYFGCGCFWHVQHEVGDAFAIRARPISSPSHTGLRLPVGVALASGSPERPPAESQFVVAEQKILGRSDAKLTSLVGYAGGNAGAKDGKVCYHNAAFVSDYGSLGHGEVVRLKVPASKCAARTNLLECCRCRWRRHNARL